MCWKFDLTGQKEQVLEAIRALDLDEAHDAPVREAARELLLQHVQRLPSDFVKVFAVGTSMGMSIEVEMVEVTHDSETLPPRATQPVPLPDVDAAHAPVNFWPY